MHRSRLFLAHSALEQWIATSRARVVDDVLDDVGSGLRFRLRSGVRFEEEVTSEGDPHQLLGRVKDTQQLATLGAEHLSDSVILGDCAYRVVEGFVGEPIPAQKPLVASVRPKVPPSKQKPANSTLASLQAFLLDNVK